MIKTAKKTLAVLLAILTLSCCFVTGAFADSTNTYTMNDITATLDEENKLISITEVGHDDTKTYVYKSEPVIEPSRNFDNPDIVEFKNLTEGKTYTITVTVDDVVKFTYSFTLKKSQDAPAAGSYKYERYATSIKFLEVKNANLEYKFGAEIDDDTAEWHTGPYEFAGLTPLTMYDFAIRYAAKDGYYASPATKISLSTKSVAQSTSVKPVAETITNNKIVLVALDGYEYSINGGDYQESPSFTSLSANTVYSFTQRVKYDEARQEESIPSETVLFKTNKSENFNANIDNSVFKVTSDSIYSSNKSTAFTVTSVQAGSSVTEQAGDTRLIPVKAYFTKGTTTVSADLALSTTAGTYSGSVTLPSSGTYTVKVEYRVEKYWISTANAEGDLNVDSNGVATLSWQTVTDDDGVVYQTKSFSSITAGSSYSKFREIFSTIMSYISKAASTVATWINKLVLGK